MVLGYRFLITGIMVSLFVDLSRTPVTHHDDAVNANVLVIYQMILIRLLDVFSHQTLVYLPRRSIHQSIGTPDSQLKDSLKSLEPPPSQD